MNQSSTMQQKFQSWLVDSGEQAILRWIFRCTLIVTVAVLALDLADLQKSIASHDTAASPVEISEESPALNLPNVLPSILAPLLPGGDKRLVMLPEPDGALARPMTFGLVGGGKLMAIGTITPGISAVFAAEVGRHGDYIKTVVLDSPGGSVADALALKRRAYDDWVRLSSK